MDLLALEITRKRKISSDIRNTINNDSTNGMIGNYIIIIIIIIITSLSLSFIL
jgi:hypothetical protein